MKLGNIKIERVKPQTRYFTQFIKEYFKNNNDLVGVEVGVQFGDNAKSLLNNLNIKKLYLVDPYEKYDGYNDGGWTKQYTQKDFDKLYSQARDKLNQFGNKCCFIRKHSKAASEDFDDNYFDFVYIDANHHQLYSDLKHWYPKARIDSGVIGGHDFCSHQPKVAHDLFRFMDENNLVFNNKTDVNGLTFSGYGDDWWIIKKKEEKTVNDE